MNIGVVDVKCRIGSHDAGLVAGGRWGSTSMPCWVSRMSLISRALEVDTNSLILEGHKRPVYDTTRTTICSYIVTCTFACGRHCS
jgi:hypothetical protein